MTRDLKHISLGRGAPSADLLPVADLARAASDAVTSDPSLALGYGAAAGHPDLRAWFAEHLGVPSERVLLTNGSLQALNFLAADLLGGGDWVAVEAPTYDFSLRVLSATGARVVGVPMRDDGLDVDHLEHLAAIFGPPAVCYVIPTFQNPTGVTMSAAKRVQLVELAAARDFLVIEDDPYRMLRFEAEEVPTILSLAPDRVVHLTSLTKLVAPGLRCGAVVLGGDLHERISLAAAQTYIAPGHFAQATAARFLLEDRLPSAMDRALLVLRERRDTLVSGLRRLGLDCVPAAGGYFAWPDTAGLSATEIVAEAARLNLHLVAGGQFFLDGRGDDRLRLTWARASAGELREALDRMESVLDNLARRGGPSRDVAELGAS